MPPTLDFSTEYTRWSFTESGKFKSRDLAAGETVIEVETAKRLTFTAKELAASNGAYCGLDCKWKIPEALLGEGVQPKPGDTWVRDSDGTEWTVLPDGVAFLEMFRVWTLSCRDLVLFHGLREEIDIERSATGRDRTGSESRDDWKSAYRLAAKVQPVLANIHEERGQHVLQTLYEVFVAEPVIVTNDDRVAWTDLVGKRHYLEIRGWRNPERVGELMVLECELVP